MPNLSRKCSKAFAETLHKQTPIELHHYPREQKQRIHNIIMPILSASKLAVPAVITNVLVLKIIHRVAHSNQEIAVLHPQSYTIKHILFTLFVEIKPKSNSPRLRSKSTEIFDRVPDAVDIRCDFHYYFYHSFVCLCSK